MEERLQAAQADLTDVVHDMVAPRVMWGGLLRLAGKRPVLAALAAVQSEQDQTRWEVLWVTDAAVIRGSAVKALQDWSAISEYPGRDGKAVDEADEVSLWSRPRSEITTVELTDVKSSKPRSGDREWRQGARVHFRLGDPLEIPLLPDRRNSSSDRGRVDAVIEALADYPVDDS